MSNLPRHTQSSIVTTVLCGIILILFSEVLFKHPDKYTTIDIFQASLGIAVCFFAYIFMLQNRKK